MNAVFNAVLPVEVASVDLEKVYAPAPSKRSLKRVVVGVSVVGENLHAVIEIDTGIRGARRTIAEGAFGDGIGRAILRGDGDGICRGGELRANGASFTQMYGMRAYVAELDNPFVAERALHGQVPLLRAGRDEFSGNDESEEKL